MQQSVLVVQRKLFVQSPLLVKSESEKGKKENCTKNKQKQKYTCKLHKPLHEINFKMQLAFNNFTKQKKNMLHVSIKMHKANC